ncbi:putative ribonuclease H-like domain-containing protein, partial [Tanacetum coccineum]
MLEFYGEKGIKQEFSNARTPQQNGVAERMNRTLIEAARTMLADSHLPTTFWAEAVNTACYTFNRVYNLVTKRVEVNLHVNFLEEKPNVQGIGHRVKGVMILMCQTEEDCRLRGVSSTSLVLKRLLQRDSLPKAPSSTPISICEKTSDFENEFATFQAKTKEAILKITTLSFCLLFVSIEQEKSQKLLKDGSWVESYAGRTLAPLNKKDERGSSLSETKQGWDAQGHRQEEGIDYDEVFAPVARIEAIRLFLAFASFMGFIVYQMDVKSAFLYGTIDEEVYVSQLLSMIGSLMYLTASRPDILVLQYGFVHVFRDSPLIWEAFSGISDLVVPILTAKSQSVVVNFLGQRLIPPLQCKKQTIVATFTTEAEYVVLHIAVDSVVGSNTIVRTMTKHIEIRHHFIRDCYEKKLISVEKIHTDLNVADLLTKPFDGPRFHYLVVSIGLVLVLLGVEKGDAKSTWTWKRKCQLSLANWMHFGCQPQPSAAPTPTHHVPTPSSSHVQITQSQSPPPPITATPPTQPPPSLTQPVQPPPTITQSSLTTPQPSSVQPTFTTPPIQPVETTSSPPMFTIPDTQPTPPPSPQVPSPSYHDTEGPSFEPSYHLSPPPSHEPENQAFRSSEEYEQLRNLMDIVPRLQSRVESLEKELSETKQTLGTAILQLTEKVKKLENKLRKKRKSKEAKDAEGQDQEVPFETDQGDTFATPEKSKGSGEAQEEQISPSTLEAAQILTNVASEGFKGSQAPLGSKIYKRKPKSTKTPTKILHFEEPDSAQVNTAQVNTAELNPDSTPSAQVNTGEVNTAEVNTGETERVQRRKGKEPMTEEDLQAEVQASKKSKELQELADLEEAQRLQAKMDAETQRQIDLDALLARRLVEQEEEAAQEALATEFDYIQARLNADQILAEKLQQEEREQYSIEDRAKFLHDTIAAQRKFLAEQRSAAI